jgi:hypothetical protein
VKKIVQFEKAQGKKWLFSIKKWATWLPLLARWLTRFSIVAA